ncbi:MAG: hypothetical protein KF770_14165 [Anaerolineae bacterium]|nr:hypothetical protein [Anaerolineae bacterium]
MFIKIRNLFVAATLLALAVLFFGWQSSVASARQPKILEFDTMVGNTQAFTGATNPIRGINGGGLPWMVAGSAKGELKTDGQLEINVKGLVLAAGPNAGSNPIANFAAIVSCLTGDGGIVNVMTGTFPATTGPASQGGGNAKIETVVALPQPCIAPIIFVTNPGGAWFAATGN